jgi:uncharacterized protein YgbK (DUF1537 family)
MNETPVSLTALLAQLPPPWPDSRLEAIRARLDAGAPKLVVLDDDPTGTQTVYDIPVLTTWGMEELAQELLAPGPVFYVLTNSRSLPLPAAQALNRAIGATLAQAAAATGRAISVVSRSDSTLRGHFPGEVAALAEGLAWEHPPTLLIPYFREGGRYTIHDVHYVAEGDRLIPAAQTPFAADAAFGYRTSNLREWVAEKSGGAVRAEDVAVISLDDLRLGGPAAVYGRVALLQPGQVCIVNAADLRDLEVLVEGLLMAEAGDRRFLYRTAASFVQIRAGLATRDLLTTAELGLEPDGGGLFVVGSYVPKTTAQVQALLATPNLAVVELDVPALLDPARRGATVNRAIQAVDAGLAAGRDTLLLTSRALITGSDAAESLAIGQSVSAALVEIVQRLSRRPRYLVGKGGITASDLATQALGVRRARVRGQLLPGVPVWEMGAETRYPGLPYVVFPGNVGDNAGLATLRARLHHED